MLFERINDDKIKIIFNTKDLKDRNIDFHSFMSTPISSQSLILELLDIAKEKLSFITTNYEIKLDIMVTLTGNFILLVTRLEKKQKNNDKNIHSSIYLFENYDEFYMFMRFIKKQNIALRSIAKNINLYEYNNKFYLIFDKHNISLTSKKFFISILEFSTYINNSDLFKRKLVEYGNIIIKNSVITNYYNFIK